MPVQRRPALLGPAEPPHEEEVHLGGRGAQPAGGELAVVGGGGALHLKMS